MSRHWNPYGKAPVKLPPGLEPKIIRRNPFEYSTVPGAPPSPAQDAKRIAENTDIIVSTQVLERGFTGKSVSVGLTPVLVVDGLFLRGYIFFNPTQSAGLTTSSTLFSSANRAALATGNTQAAPTGVANFRNAALFLDITGGTGGAVTIDVQSQDPVSAGWVTTQSAIFGAPSAVGTYYANVGSIGVDTSFAAVFTIGAGGTSTFSLSLVLKDGLPGGASGLANTIFLGGEDVNSTTGFPLREGAAPLEKYFRPNTRLWAVSLISGGIDLSVFELQ